MKCSVCRMPSSHARRDGITYHKLPLHKALRNQWLDTLGVTKKYHLDNVFVCSEHFKESDLIKVGRKTHLRPQAFPLPFKGTPYERPLPKSESKYDLPLIYRKVRPIRFKIIDNHKTAESSQPIDNSSSNMENITLNSTTDSNQSTDKSFNNEKTVTLTTDCQKETNSSENTISSKNVTSTSAPQKAHDSQPCPTAYIDPQNYVSPYPVWYMHSYMAGHSEIEAVPFTTTISRYTQTGVDSDSETEEGKSLPSHEKILSSDPPMPTIILTQNEKKLKVAIYKAFHQLEKWKSRIQVQDSKIRAVQKKFRHADIRFERLQQQIRDCGPPRRRRKPTTSRPPRPRKKASSIPAPGPTIENECTIDLNNSVLSKEDVLDISHLSSIADLVEVGQVIQLPILGTNESVNVIVTSVPTEADNNAINGFQNAL